MAEEPVTPVQAESAAAPPKRRSRTWVWVLVVLLVVALAAAGFFAFAEWSRTRDAEAALGRASTLLERAEVDLIRVDEAVQLEIASVTATQAIEAAELADAVHADVAEASEIIVEALPDLPEQRLDLALALRESADARAEMMELAPGILEADAMAAEAIVAADQAVAEIKAAEELSAQAAAEFNKHTAEGVRASDALSVQAEERLRAAASLLATATSSFPGADFAAFNGYIEAKLGLIALAKEIDALWLAGDVAGSNTKLAAYNQRDAEIVAMAQALPASVRDPIADAYEAQTAEAMEQYFAARERARVAGELVSKIRQTTTVD